MTLMESLACSVQQKIYSCAMSAMLTRFRAAPHERHYRIATTNIVTDWKCLLHVAHDWEQEAFESFFNPEPKTQNKVNEKKRGNPRAILMSKHLSAAVETIVGDGNQPRLSYSKTSKKRFHTSGKSMWSLSKTSNKPSLMSLTMTSNMPVKWRTLRCQMNHSWFRQAWEGGKMFLN